MKGKISANGTYVFAAEDLEELDELSFTSILSAVSDLATPPPPLQSHQLPATESTERGDTTINEMLSTPDSPVDRRPAPSDVTGIALEEAPRDLIDAALVFPELCDPERGPR